jgi:hypothetical protein
MAVDAEDLGFPAPQDVAPPPVRQHIAGLGLATLVTMGVVFLLFAVLVGIVALLFAFGVPRLPG